MTTPNHLLIATLAAAALTAGTATAASVQTTNPINIYAYDALGVNTGQVFAELTLEDRGSDVLFSITKLMGETPVSRIYFESGFSLISPYITGYNSAEYYNDSDGSLPANAAVLGWDATSFQVLFSGGRGLLEAGDVLEIGMTTSLSFDELTAAVGSPTLRLAFMTSDATSITAALAQSDGALAGGPVGNVSAVPTPTAALAGAVLLGLAGLRRRAA